MSRFFGGYNYGIMGKKLLFGLILAVTSVQVIPILPLLAQEKNDGSKHPNNANQNNPITQQSIVHQQDSGKTNEKGQKKDPPSAKDSFDYAKGGFLVSLWLTAITFLIAVASVIQASAARISVKAVMLSERAWMLPDGEKIGLPTLIPSDSPTNPRKFPVTCSIALRNCGNTPATAIDWEFELRIGPSQETPPSLEIYEKKSPEDRKTPFPIGPGWPGHAQAVLKPQEYISTAEKAEIDAGTKHVWLCGIARYRDVFERRKFLQNSGNLHETKVCLRYMARSDGSSGRWILGGPSGYNKAT